MSAPIALFIFNRPDHLRKTLAALTRCQGFEGSPLFVFADGARSADDASGVEEARKMAREVLGPRATYIFQDGNKGLARSIIDGVSHVVAQHGRAIVLEDDLDLAPGFLVFMNEALDRYEDDDVVFQVSGYAFNAPELASRSNAAFLPFIGTWGWATWRRAWSQLDEDASGWEALRSDMLLRRLFNLDGSYDYATMMERQMVGRRDSWGIRWYWSVFVRHGLVLYPPRTLVSNEGFDGSGSHGRGLFRRFGGARQQFMDGPILLPAVPKLDLEALAAVRQALSRQNGGLLGRYLDLIKRLAGRVVP